MQGVEKVSCQNETPELATCSAEKHKQTWGISVN